MTGPVLSRPLYSRTIGSAFAAGLLALGLGLSGTANAFSPAPADAAAAEAPLVQVGGLRLRFGSDRRGYPGWQDDPFRYRHRYRSEGIPLGQVRIGGGHDHGHHGHHYGHRHRHLHGVPRSRVRVGNTVFIFR